MCGCDSYAVSCCRNLAIAGNNASDAPAGQETFFGNGAPAATLGKEDDNYFDVQNQRAYKKNLGVWDLKGNT